MSDCTYQGGGTSRNKKREIAGHPSHLRINQTILQQPVYLSASQKLVGSVWHFKRVPCQSVNIKF